MIASLTSLAVAAGIAYGLWRLIRAAEPARCQHRPVVVMDGQVDHVCRFCGELV